MRLHKYLAECGVASRRAAEALIAQGRVRVNGAVAKVGSMVEPGADRIEVNGVEIGRDRKVYIVLNKPAGTVTTAKDTHNRKTVLDCLDGVAERVFPIGRLDYDVSGALLLTNDGELSHRVMHPSYEIRKVYMAWVRGVMRPETAKRLEEGVELEDGVTAPARASILKITKNTTLIRLTIHEGRKRLVKRMCAAVGHPVKNLRRISVASIRCTGLRPGEWRYLTDEEVALLRRLTKLGTTNGKPA